MRWHWRNVEHLYVFAFGCYLVDECERAVDAEVLQPLVAQQRLVGHEQRVELGSVLRLRGVLDVLVEIFVTEAVIMNYRVTSLVQDIKSSSC